MDFKYRFTDAKVRVSDVNKTEQEILEIIEKEVKDIVEHFSEYGGYPLDKGTIITSVMFDILGFCLEDQIDNAIFNEGLFHRVNSYGSFYEEEADYKPIYMNIRTGKLIVVEDSTDKSYIFKYSEQKGYVQIGRL